MQGALDHDVVTRFFRLEARPVVAAETVLTSQRDTATSGGSAAAVKTKRQAPKLNRAARRAQERRERKRRARAG